MEGRLHPRDSRVGEEHVKLAVTTHGLIDNALHGLLVGRIERLGVDVYCWPSLIDLSLVTFQVRIIVVAQIEYSCSVLRILVRRRTPDAQS
jgi:hypothetical protein